MSGEKGWRERKVGKRKRLDGKEGYAGGRMDGEEGLTKMGANIHELLPIYLQVQFS